MKYEVCNRSFSGDDLVATVAFLAEVDSGIILLGVYSLFIEEAHLASAILGARLRLFLGANLDLTRGECVGCSPSMVPLR